MEQTIFRHRGYEMRSQSEVMWARFMDALRVRWVYEPEVIDTRHGWYLPDFYLPACGMYLEIKGPYPSKEEVEKAADAQSATGCPVVFGHSGKTPRQELWFQGELAYFTGIGAATMSMAEITALVDRHEGVHGRARVLGSRMVERYDGCRKVGDLLSEMLDAWMDRSALEQSKRRTHEPLNQQTLDAFGQHSVAEWVASEFVKRARRGPQKEAA